MAKVYDHILESVRTIQERVNAFSPGFHPEIGIILGSGLGQIANRIENPVSIPYTDIPHFHGTSVEGHAGKMILGKFHGVPCVFLQGRVDGY
jgi:purine-nucleoside phosphorylase